MKRKNQKSMITAMDRFKLFLGAVMCWLGFHEWLYNHQTKPTERVCNRIDCNKRQKPHYDGCYGDTIWE